MSNAVEFIGVWKKFRKGEKFNSLRDAIPNFMKNLTNITGQDVLDEQEFWATKNVSFTIPKGQVVGIMGPNGAGKSTVLKLLSGIMSPTKGSMKITGRLSALIEVTAGFHPELTGRENVYLNGTILGMSRKEIAKKFDEITAFSGVDQFIDTPVKRYSSGMYSRLGFSVAAHMDPEILVVDEVLSVGDISFQAKCAQKMRELMASGATIILVSHQIPLVQSLCKRAILLNHGEVLKDGPTDDVIPHYQNITFKKTEEDFRKKVKLYEEKVKVEQESLVDIINVSLREEFISGEDVSINIEYNAKEKIDSPIVIIDFMRSDGVLCCSLSSKDSNLNLRHISHKGSIQIQLPSLKLDAGIYLIKISFWDREMIHPYVVRNKEVIRVVVPDKHISSNAVFIPDSAWDARA